MSSGKLPQPRQKPVPNNTPAVVHAHELYTYDELARRLRWQEHSRRQAKRLGLKTIRFGSRDYVLGKHALEFYEQLAEQQAKDTTA